MPNEFSWNIFNWNLSLFLGAYSTIYQQLLDNKPLPESMLTFFTELLLIWVCSSAIEIYDLCLHVGKYDNDLISLQNDLDVVAIT